MPQRIVLVALALGAALAFVPPAPTASGPGEVKPAASQAGGPAKRVPWTTSRVRGSPDPPSPYRTEPAFPKLPKSDEPLDLTHLPGTDRLVVTERYGRVFTVRNDPKTDKADLLLDLNRHLGRTDPKTLAVYGFA